MEGVCYTFLSRPCCEKLNVNHQWHRRALARLTFQLVPQLETREGVHEDWRVQLVLGEDKHAAVAVGCQDADAPHVTVKHSLFLGLQVQEADVTAAHVAHRLVVHELQTARALDPAGCQKKKKKNLDKLSIWEQVISEAYLTSKLPTLSIVQWKHVFISFIKKNNTNWRIRWAGVFKPNVENLEISTLIWEF